jgi:hypothetical protein
MKPCLESQQLYLELSRVLRQAEIAGMPITRCGKAFVREHPVRRYGVRDFQYDNLHSDIGAELYAQSIVMGLPT